MYKVRGADQKEYGPVNQDVLRQWIAEGRATAQTLIQAEGATAWKPISEFPELGAALAGALRPPTLPYLAAQGAAPTGPAKTSGMAIASLVLGILGLCTAGIGALAGLVLGIVALSKINRSQGRLEGKGLAIAGICVSGFMFLFGIPFSAALFLPAFAKGKAKAQTINCVNQMKQLTLAMRMYTADYKDTFPAANNWCTAIQTYVSSPKAYQCPADRTGQRCSYSFNAKLGGRNTDKVDPQTVMFFEGSGGGWNISGGSGTVITHHFQTCVVGLADGSVMQIPVARMSQLRWDP